MDDIDLDIRLFPEKARIGVAIFTYNEEDTVPSVVLLARNYTDNVMVFDDGSRDDTRIMAKISDAKLNKKRKNRGKGHGIKEAFSWARHEKFDVLVTIDGDGQHDPGIIPFLVEPVIKGDTDITIGSKGFNFEGKSKKGFSWRLGNWMTKRVGMSRSSASVYDRKSGYRAYHARTFGNFNFLSDGFDQETIMLDQAAKNGFRIKEIPMKVIYGNMDRKDLGFGNWMLKVISETLYKFRIKTPMRLAVLISSSCVIVASISAIYAKVNYPNYDFLPPGGIYVTVFFMALAGFILLNGIIFEAIAHVGSNMLSYLQKNDRVRLEYDPLKGFQR